MRSLLLYAMACWSLVWLCASSATAQDPVAVEEARTVFSHGIEAYEAGDFEQALTDFQRAYELTHDAQILYNVGTVADRLRRDAVALEAYEGYLSGYPEAPDRANVEARIAALRAVSRPEVSAVPTPEAPTEEEPSPESVLETAPPRSSAAQRMGEGGLAFLVTGGVLVLGGASLLIAAAVEIDAANRAETWAAFMGPFERIPILSAVGWISLGLGGALGALGVGWLVASSGDASSTLALRVGPMHLSLEGTF